jgi:hypothetical protein
VDSVLVSAVDSKDNPKEVEVYLCSAREQIAKIAGVPLEAVKLDLRLEA